MQFIKNARGTPDHKILLTDLNSSYIDINSALFYSKKLIILFFNSTLLLKAITKSNRYHFTPTLNYLKNGHLFYKVYLKNRLFLPWDS
jgi:hypothetical protein